MQPESDGSRSGSSLSLRNIAGNDAAAGSGAGGNSSIQSPTHRGVHRSISASSTKPSRRASSGAETLRKYLLVVSIHIEPQIHTHTYLCATTNKYTLSHINKNTHPHTHTQTPKICCYFCSICRIHISNAN